MWNSIKAFLLGMKEFRLTYTTKLPDNDVEYEWGREWAHRLTFHRYEPH